MVSEYLQTSHRSCVFTEAPCPQLKPSEHSQNQEPDFACSDEYAKQHAYHFRSDNVRRLEQD